ncbi:MAG: hypothetical protein ACKOA1_02160 [Bacteroidota bacterium]
MSIIAVVFSFLFFSWYLLFISSSGRISVEEFYFVGLFFALWSLAFSIVVTVKTFRNNIQ